MKCSVKFVPFSLDDFYLKDIELMLESLKRQQQDDSFHGCAHERENKRSRVFRKRGDAHCESRPAPTERSDEPSCSCSASTERSDEPSCRSMAPIP
ncbi:unnamed protein product [Angiostrongylus costaricensis]|uniref:Cyclin-dependent kinase inhibitor 1B n=1 Tax=Angiostrongylus costaricensis TaxID=334426 RepID=A0A0R3PNB4_ANGCS|nr:unnamed protein product [Angiostrongylus costaricensis]